MMVAKARVSDDRGRKRTVDVTVSVGGKGVMTGTFTCFVLDTHVLQA